jgi:hypothetical protein
VSKRFVNEIIMIIIKHLKKLVVVVRLFIDTQNRLVALHSVLVKAHEETDTRPHSVIHRPIGSTKQCSKINQILASLLVFLVT